MYGSLSSCMPEWVLISPPHWINNLVKYQILGTKLFFWSLKVIVPLSSSTGVADENDVYLLILLLVMCFFCLSAFSISSYDQYSEMPWDYFYGSFFIYCAGYLGSFKLKPSSFFHNGRFSSIISLFPPLPFHSSFLKLLLHKCWPIWIDLLCIFFLKLSTYHFTLYSARSSRLFSVVFLLSEFWFLFHVLYLF